MTKQSIVGGAALIALGLPLGMVALRRAPDAGAVLPPPAAAAQDVATRPGLDTAVFAGGCFWGIEAVFEHVKGVTDAVSGYAGGNAQTAEYETVSTGSTGHAESVQVVFDPSQISYGKLLQIFFSVAHDPTQLNRQGPDVGTQYRSAIFYRNAEQERVARAYIAQLTKAHVFQRPIVTQVVPLDHFYMAEAYHQDYMEHHPDQPYIVYNDRPKLVHLQQQFPELYRSSDARSGG
ncbi:MAG TPA: peptide-methionine (S)-S-oxide reductase MsrA [Gemmatimonadaceae bacterium]|nr:peptide-methionine (S)-S-oxide reductase MsrA [Gemmatimonadaceae bacterium]